MSVRRHVVFKSNAFNTTQPRDYFINDCCFGDDLARWLLERLRERAIATDAEPGQEDFGWYISFEFDGQKYDLVITYRPEDEDQQGVWMCSVERSLGLLKSILGRRKKKIAADAVQTIDKILKDASEINAVRWYTDEDVQAERNPSATPTA